MKTMILILMLLSLSFAHATTGPFQPHNAKRFKTVEDRATANEISKVIRSVLDASSTLADNSSTTLLVLPASASVTKMYALVQTALASASGNTLEVKCEASGDLFAASTIVLAVDDAFDLIPGGAGTNMLLSPGGCNVIATVASGDTGITAGKLIFFTEFVLSE